MPKRVVPEFEVESHELAEGFEAAESAEDGGRVEGGLAPAARDAQGVGLVRLQLREILRPSTKMSRQDETGKLAQFCLHNLAILHAPLRRSPRSL